MKGMRMRAPTKGLKLREAFRAPSELTNTVGKGLKGIGKWK